MNAAASEHVVLTLYAPLNYYKAHSFQVLLGVKEDNIGLY